jgi:hypothetical protein
LVRFREERERGGTEIGAAPGITSSGKRSIDQCVDPYGARVPATAALAATLDMDENWRIGSIESSGTASPDW